MIPLAHWIVTGCRILWYQEEHAQRKAEDSPVWADTGESKRIER